MPTILYVTHEDQKFVLTGLGTFPSSYKLIKSDERLQSIFPDTATILLDHCLMCKNNINKGILNKI